MKATIIKRATENEKVQKVIVGYLVLKILALIGAVVILVFAIWNHMQLKQRNAELQAQWASERPQTSFSERQEESRARFAEIAGSMQSWFNETADGLASDSGSMAERLNDMGIIDFNAIADEISGGRQQSAAQELISPQELLDQFMH